MAQTDNKSAPLVSIIMGSKSDLPTMQHAADVLGKLEIPYEIKVISAHRTPLKTMQFAQEAQGRGIKVIIAGAGGAAHLAGVVSALTTLPVLGVPMQGEALRGIDSLLSIVQMPGGVPVGTLAIGNAGATNAGLLAAAILGIGDPKIQERYKAYRESITKKLEQETDPT